MKVCESNIKKQNMNFKSYGSEEFDNHFKKMEGLLYFPFIGDGYSKAKQRILIVGESHYADGNKKSLKLHESNYLTRSVIKNKAIDRVYNKKNTFRNFHKALLENDEFDSKKLWRLLSFFNLIQKPMYSIKDRPSKADFLKGWSALFKVIKIIKPTTIIFIGVGASDYLNKSVSQNEFYIKNLKRDDKISRTFPRKCNLITKEKNSTQLIFIQHTGHHFSHQKWNNYLGKKLSKEINWLKQNTI